MQMILSQLDGNNIDELIHAVLSEIEDQISTYKKDLSLKGKNLRTANVEHPSHMARYDEIKVNLKSLLDYYDMVIKKIRGESLRMLSEDHDRVYSTTEKEKLIDANPKYLRYQAIYLRIKELHGILASISEQFKNRAYTLNNLVKIYAAALDDITLEID